MATEHSNVQIDGTVDLPEKHQHGSAIPKLERHISTVPDGDDDCETTTTSSRKVKEKFDKLKDHLKPHSHHSSEDSSAATVHSQPKSTSTSQQDSGFEVSPLMSFDSNSSAESKDGGEKKKKKGKGESRGGVMSKLERTVSSIPQYDYDSDGEGRL